MKTAIHTYANVSTWVVYVPGNVSLRTFADYQKAWEYSEKVLTETGHVATVEAIR